MWKQNFGMSIGNHYSIPTTEVVKLLRKTGFDAVSPEWSDMESLAAIAETARECGMALQSLHAPFGKAAALWSSDPAAGKAALDELYAPLDACEKFRIPVMVAHVWIGFDYRFDAQSLDFAHFDALVRRAAEKGIRIAFENTEGEEFLFALMAHFAGNDTVGFCWDSGHELCYNHGQDLLARFGDRLLVTHLNDNLGISRFDGTTFWTDDLHLLPYDGIADWDYNIARLRRSRRIEFLNFELALQSKPHRHENDAYAEMPLERYFAEVYKRACRIGARLSSAD